MPYSTIQIPPKKDPKKFTYLERRAEIFKLILLAGHPKLISQTELGKRYGKSQPMISQDIDAIADEIKENIGSDAELVTTAVYEKALTELIKSNSNKDKFLAAKLVMEWNNYLFDMGKRKRAPQFVEHSGELELGLKDAVERARKLKKVTEHERAKAGVKV